MKIHSKHSSYPCVRETSQILYLKPVPSLFMFSCEEDFFLYSSCRDIPIIILTLMWGRLPPSHILHVETFPSFFSSLCEGDVPYSSYRDINIILLTLMWARLPIFIMWRYSHHSSHPHVRETSHILHVETFLSFFSPSCEGDFPYSWCEDVPIIILNLMWGRLPIFLMWRRSHHYSESHVRETSHILNVKMFPSLFWISCEGDFPYS